MRLNAKSACGKNLRQGMNREYKALLKLLPELTRAHDYHRFSICKRLGVFFPQHVADNDLVDGIPHHVAHSFGQMFFSWLIFCVWDDV